MSLSFEPKILILISATISFILSWVIFQRSKKNKVNISFALFTFFIALWSLCFYFYFYPIIFSHLIWIKLVYLVAFFIIPPALYFLFSFPIRRVKSFLLPGIIYTICSLILTWFLFFTDLWVKEVIVYPLGPQTITGSVYFLYFLFVGILVVPAFYNLIRNYFSFKGVLKAQLKFILIGVFLFGIPTIIVDIVLPLISGNSRYFWLSPVFSIFIVISTTYAITRYRLMDIKLVITKGVIYLLSFIFIIALANLLLFLNIQLLTPIPTNIATFLILIIGILIFQPLFRFFERFASRYFYYTFYSYQAVLSGLAKKLTQVLELNKLSSLIINTLKNTIKLDKIVILLKNKNGGYDIQNNIGFKKERVISLVKDNFLATYLERTQMTLVYEELFSKINETIKREGGNKLKKLQTNMEKIEAALCLPLFMEETIIGMIILGNKVSGELYSKQDINLLTNLSDQASIAFQNAKLYSEVKGFSKKLEEEVEKATKELKKAYRELKKLDEAKSEFISIASHQLRTPLTAIKGYISMIHDRTYGVPPEKMEKPLRHIYISVERLIKLVSELLNISRIEAGKVKAEFEISSLEYIINSVITELKSLVKEKDLYLEFKKGKEPLPKISIDKEKMRQVILNVIDNAIRYTKEGGVTVKCKKKENTYQVKVSDTGEGMTKGEISDLFKSFSRGKAGKKGWVEGAGLGLYIAKKYVDMHKGKIWAKSQGKGKGSTFYIELPIQ